LTTQNTKQKSNRFCVYIRTKSVFGHSNEEKAINQGCVLFYCHSTLKRKTQSSIHSKCWSSGVHIPKVQSILPILFYKMHALKAMFCENK